MFGKRCDLQARPRSMTSEFETSSAIILDQPRNTEPSRETELAAGIHPGRDRARLVGRQSDPGVPCLGAAIVPLAGLMGDATEALAEYLGPTLGGLLNATLGNAPEIIISLFALNRGLIGIVKSSLTGSIIGNLLFGLGVSMVAGGLKVKTPEVRLPCRPDQRRTAGACIVRVDHSGDLPDGSAGGVEPAGMSRWRSR